MMSKEAEREYQAYIKSTLKQRLTMFTSVTGNPIGDEARKRIEELEKENEVLDNSLQYYVDAQPPI